MSAMALGGLIAVTRQQKKEAPNFEAFLRASPSFAGRPITSVEWGGDPPDILCLDAAGSRIGLELVQWVKEDQIARSKRREGVEDSFKKVIRSRSFQAPANFGITHLLLNGDVPLSTQDISEFAREIRDLVEWVDSTWYSNPDKDDPQGIFFTNLYGYPCLAKYLIGLHITRALRGRVPFGVEWLTFEDPGGAYSPDWMRDALWANISMKVQKYSQPNDWRKLQQQRLDEFYLLVYYDEAVIYNTPYEAPGFGFQQVAAFVRSELAAIQHPFGKVFLFVSYEVPAVICVYP